MTNRDGWKNLFIAGLLILCAAVAPAQEQITEEGFITGKMKIDFNTRTSIDNSGDYVDGTPAKGAKDVYDLSLTVAKTTEFAGKITRHPRLVTRVLGREEQPASLDYDITLAVRNPKDLSQKKNVGKWVGPIMIDTNGVYNFGGGQGSQLRIAVDAIGKAQAFTSNFSGRIVGQASTEKGVLESTYTEYSRMVKGKKVTVKVKDVDPLTFQNLKLAMGPAANYPETVVNGNLDFDYETGNWYTNGIRFKYTFDGKEIEDLVTGSIKWIEDENRETNGKGQYEFNLRFNEMANAPATDEAAVFSDDAAASEAAFFEVDNTVPSLTGTITYVDSIVGTGDELTVTASEIAYDLDANKLTKQQALNFFKLWIVVTGPVNDE